VGETKEEVVVTKNGKPIALIQRINDRAFKLKMNLKGVKKVKI
jgi:antitoxin (DNA-binding transcriptional repressor) of toxin-antitoxin stability system